MNLLNICLMLSIIFKSKILYFRKNMNSLFIFTESFLLQIYLYSKILNMAYKLLVEIILRDQNFSYINMPSVSTKIYYKTLLLKQPFRDYCISLLVVDMYVNNELGTENPINQISELTKKFQKNA